MSVLSDRELSKLGASIIHPFLYKQLRGSKKKPQISYGLSSYGYDLRLGNEFLLMNLGLMNKVVDPKNFDPGLMQSYHREDHESFTIPAGGFCLSTSKEDVIVPRDCIVICIGKSTYTRCGIFPYVTPLEPEWHGTVTIEIMNHAPYPALVYAGEGICQIIFLKADTICQTSYADRKGKYQGQQGVTLAKG